MCRSKPSLPAANVHARVAFFSCDCRDLSHPHASNVQARSHATQEKVARELKDGHTNKMCMEANTAEVHAH